MERVDYKRMRVCIICGRIFVPNKYRPGQKVCSSPMCQHMRQLLNQKRWRQKNPDYFCYKERKENDFWAKKRYLYLKQWREKHREYFVKYRQLKAKEKDKNGQP